MGISADDYLRQMQALLPLGPAWPRDDDSELTRLLAGFSSEFARIDGEVTGLAEEADPRTANEFLPDWERVAGESGVGSYQSRIAELVSDLTASGSMSIPFFINLADRLGYAIWITEPVPFIAGSARCGDQIANYPDVMHQWTVTVLNGDAGNWSFRAGSSAAGDRVLNFGITEIETLFGKLKPAHTQVNFAYLNGYWLETEAGAARIYESGEAKMPVLIE